MKPNEVAERILAIEDCMGICNKKIDNLGKDVTDLLNQNRVILKWIFEHFGVQLSRNSQPETNNNVGDQRCSFTPTSNGQNSDSVEEASQHNVSLENSSDDSTESIPEVPDMESVASDHGVPKRGRPCKLSENGYKETSSQCDQCGKLVQVGSLRQHKMTHTDPKYPCQECGKNFRRKFHLKTHLLIHSGDKRHQCRFCGVLFLLPKDLIAHERIHSKERPFICDRCPKTFTLKSHLTMHIRTHTGEKPYICLVCNKGFSQSNSLRIHKKVHLR